MSQHFSQGHTLLFSFLKNFYKASNGLKKITESESPDNSAAASPPKNYDGANFARDAPTENVATLFGKQMTCGKNMKNCAVSSLATIFA